MSDLKPCPFCGGDIHVIQHKVSVASREIECECQRCYMNFRYTQAFAISKKARVAMDEPFESLWNRRVSDG